tara:strand:- start:297 stop:479 length:183 start_codon:yes stop_codon:yes gene_type:complete
MKLKKWWWIVFICFSLSVGCTSPSIPSEVKEVELDSVGLVEKDGVIVNIPIPTTTITTIE